MKSIYDYILENNLDLEKELSKFISSREERFYISISIPEDDIDGVKDDLCRKYKLKELYIERTDKYDYLKDIQTGNKTIYITDIIVSEKGSGYGEKVMNIISNVAKKYKYDIALHPDDMFGSELKRLVGFYEKCGYKTSEKAIKQNIKSEGQHYIMFKYCE